MNACPQLKKELTIQECVDRLEKLFKSYQKDSEFNYQLSVSDSPFNTLKHYVKALEIIKRNAKIVDYSEHNGVAGEELIIFQGFSIKSKEDYNLLREVLKCEQ